MPDTNVMPPSEWVERHLPTTTEGARALDVACGGGRHLRLALSRGFRVTGIDRDIGGCRAPAGDSRVLLVQFDLEAGVPPPFRGEQFDAVIVTNYLHRPLFDDLIAAVAPGGLLIYETFQFGQERIGRPSNPDFLLRPGELLDVVRDRLEVVAYEQGRHRNPERIVQRMCARRV